MVAVSPTDTQSELICDFRIELFLPTRRISSRAVRDRALVLQHFVEGCALVGRNQPEDVFENASALMMRLCWFPITVPSGSWVSDSYLAR
jgi:hypothetical protein